MSSPENNIERREKVQAALKAFADTLMAKATQLLNALGYVSEKTADLGNNAELFLGHIERFKPEFGPIDRNKVQAEPWKECAFLFQRTNDEIPSLLLPLAGEGQGERALRECRYRHSFFWQSNCRENAGRVPNWRTSCAS